MLSSKYASLGLSELRSGMLVNQFSSRVTSGNNDPPPRAVATVTAAFWGPFY